MKNRRTWVAAATGLVVLCAAIGVLLQASRGGNIFEPTAYEKFENNMTPGDSIDAVAGDGDSTLADENEDGQGQGQDEASEQQTIGRDQEWLDDLEQQDNADPNSLGIADVQDGTESQTNRTALSLTVDNEGGTVAVNPVTEQTGETLGEGDEEPGVEEPGAEEPEPSISVEEQQLVDRDPVVTTYGELLSIDVETPSNWSFYMGESYSPAGVTVTATFRQDGQIYTRELSYNTSDGYTVRMSTKTRGQFYALFYYTGDTTVTGTAPYTVESSYINLSYLAVYGGNNYATAYPGDVVGLVNQQLTGLDRVVYPSVGGYIDLTGALGRFIAILGDADMEDVFSDYLTSAGANTYQSVVFLQTDEDGWLTTMVGGFRRLVSGVYQDEQAYVYYPYSSWGDNVGQSAVGYVVSVPEGYHIVRVTEGEGTESYTGQQVLCGYVGDDEVMDIPLGVTEICLVEENDIVSTMLIPESVTQIWTGFQMELENLEDIELEGHSQWSVADGSLYSQDGETLLAVPEKKTSFDGWTDTVKYIESLAFAQTSLTELTVPETVIWVGENAFWNSGIQTMRFLGETVPEGVDSMGYSGLLLVSDTAYDTLEKTWVIALGPESTAVVSVADDEGEPIDEKTGLYMYSAGDIAVYADAPTMLAGVCPSVSGRYVLPEGITAVGAGAFAAAQNVYELVLPSTLETLGDESLAGLSGVDSLVLQSGGVTLSDAAFGADVPNVSVYVPAQDYEDYLKAWSQVLDPVYGVGTAERILQVAGDDYLYENGARYQVLADGSYCLVRVYDTDASYFQVREGTTQIQQDALRDCDRLEILCLPESLQSIDPALLAGCTGLEMVVNSSQINLSLENVTVCQAGEEFDSFVCDDGAVYGLRGDVYTLINVVTDYAGALTLRENTQAIAAYALADCTEVSTVYSPDGMLRSIGAYAFRNCTGITILNFRTSTELTLIDRYAFQGCTAMQRLLAPSVTTLGEGAFYGCSAMTSVSLVNIQSVPELCFYGCEKLQSLSAPNITAIGAYAFSQCAALLQVDVLYGSSAADEDEDSANGMLTTIGAYAFQGCSALQKVQIPSSVVSIGEGCFSDCVRLSALTLNGQVEYISRYCFSGCMSLSTIEFGESQKQTLRIIGVEAFARCGSLESLDLTELENLSRIGSRAFANCTSLNQVRLPQNLTDIYDECFTGCRSLSLLTLKGQAPVTLGDHVFGSELTGYLHIWVAEELLEDYRAAFTPVLDETYGAGTTDSLLGVENPRQQILQGVVFEKKEDDTWLLVSAPKSLSGTYTVPDSVSEIADEAFSDCKELTCIVLPATATISLGDRCFVGCDNLVEADLYSNIPYWGDETFMDCTSLAKVYLGKNVYAYIDRVGTRAFKGCTGLTGTDSVYFRSGIRVLGEECFAGCTNLVGIPTTTGSGSIRELLEVIEAGAFRDCVSMTVSPIGTYLTALTTIGDYAFANCDSLKQPSVPASVTSIGVGCFMDCDNLLYVSIYGAVEEYPKDCFKNCPKLIRTGGTATAFASLKRIGESAYEGCASLTISANWQPGKYTALEQIGANAFKGCETLIDFYLSASVTRIGAGAFDGCIGIEKLSLYSQTPPEMGALDLSSLSADFQILVNDSQETEDSIYKAYLTALTELYGADVAYGLLDSRTDGARDRNDPVQSVAEILDDEEAVSQEMSQETEAEAAADGASEEMPEQADEKATEEQVPEEQTTEETETPAAPPTPEPESTGIEQTLEPETSDMESATPDDTQSTETTIAAPAETETAAENTTTEDMEQ